jgi:hypothetical protein
MKNRKAWGLVGALAVVVLGGSGWLFALHQSQLSPEDRWLTLLPRSEWGFGTAIRVSRGHGFGPAGWESFVHVHSERRNLGFFSVRVK